MTTPSVRRTHGVMRSVLAALFLGILGPGLGGHGAALAADLPDPPVVMGWGTAEESAPETIGWEALVPHQGRIIDPLAELDMWARDDLRFAAKALAELEQGLVGPEDAVVKLAEDMLAAMRTDGLEVDGLLLAMAARDRLVERRRLEINPKMDGAFVRIPGYALPLNGSGAATEEFLLVPYVGACIHYPPPPPNQAVLAKLERAHAFERRYEAVWIIGRLSAVSSASALDYVDGNVLVPTGWSMFVDRIEPYGADRSGDNELGNFSPIVAGPKLDLSRRGGVHRSQRQKAE